jgi:hypothetical protein
MFFRFTASYTLNAPTESWILPSKDYNSAEGGEQTIRPEIDEKSDS